eukprot:5153199-Amphidinium_carterae.1
MRHLRKPSKYHHSKYACILALASGVYNDIGVSVVRLCHTETSQKPITKPQKRHSMRCLAKNVCKSTEVHR